MDAHLFRSFTRILLPLLSGARIEKIQEPEPGIMTIAFYGGGRKRQLWIKFGRKNPFCFLSDTRLGAGKEPSAQVMRIRRYFANRRAASVVGQVFSRKLWILATSGEETSSGKAVWLCLDLANGPSLHFLDASSYPEGENPHWPEPAELANAMKDWRNWPVLTPALRRSLSHMDEPDQWALLEDLRAGNGNIFLYSSMLDGKKHIEHVSAWPIPKEDSRNWVEEECEDIYQAIQQAGGDLVQGAIYEKRQENLLAPVKRRIKNIHKLLEKLEGEEERFKNMVSRGQAAQIISENLWKLDKDDRRDSIQLPAGPDGALDVISLDRRLNIRENMERMFHTARRGKRGLAMLEERRADLLKELSGLEATRTAPVELASEADNTNENSEKCLMKDQQIGKAAAALRKSLPRNVALYVSSDGYLILRGKDSKGNHAMRRYAAPHDLWAHVETGPGAHIIIRRSAPGREVPARTLDEAGGLAAIKSWLSGSATAPVMFAEMRHVKPARNGPAGKMIIDRLQFVRDVPVDGRLEKNIIPLD